MRIFNLDFPKIHTNIYNVTEKSGNRTEFSLNLNEELKHLGNQITNKPLKFASYVLAKPGNEDQDWHKDSEEGERALIYLSDVHEENGPLEFENGKVFGSKGTVIHYNANELHRGCKTNQDRMVLALAFSNSNQIINTIGNATTAKKNEINWPLVIGIIILVILFFMAYARKIYYYNYY